MSHHHTHMSHHHTCVASACTCACIRIQTPTMSSSTYVTSSYTYVTSSYTYVTSSYTYHIIIHTCHIIIHISVRVSVLRLHQYHARASPQRVPLCVLRLSVYVCLYTCYASPCACVSMRASPLDLGLAEYVHCITFMYMDRRNTPRGGRFPKPAFVEFGSAE
jgi:hypothetical protein